MAVDDHGQGQDAADRFRTVGGVSVHGDLGKVESEFTIRVSKAKVKSINLS
jgi:hypothetical protein